MQSGELYGSLIESNGGARSGTAVRFVAAVLLGRGWYELR
jgi:hypothetical protein